MKTLTLLIIPFLFLSCQQDTLEEYFVPLEACNYFPSPCSLISMEQFIEISGSTPFPISNTFGVDNTESMFATELKCEMGFTDEADEIYVMSGTMNCFRNSQSNVFDDLSQVSSFTNDAFISEAAFEQAIYYPNINAYIIRKENHVLEIVFENFTKEQQIDIATIMLSNLP